LIVLHRDDGTRGAFYIEDSGRQVAEMTYVWAGSAMIIIDHTGVDEALRGAGAGRELVSASVAFARDKGIRIMPLCPFAKSVFQRVTEFRDVL
jgi:uncharacterized protein